MPRPNAVAEPRLCGQRSFLAVYPIDASVFGCGVRWCLGASLSRLMLSDIRCLHGRFSGQWIDVAMA